MEHDYAGLLRFHRMRVTAARIAVLCVAHDYPHSDVDTIRHHVEHRLGSISGQAIYDAINSLTDAGILRRIAPAGTRARYEFDTGDNHHHIVCTRCGQMDDIECDTRQAPCMNPTHLHGWQLQRAEIYFWGLCATCAEKVSTQEDRTKLAG